MSIEDNTQQIGELNKEIKTLGDEIGQLAASIDKADSDIAQLGSKIAALDNAMTELAKEEEAATEERNEQHDLFEKKDTDLGESVDALDRAVAEMLSRTPDVKMLKESKKLKSQTI